MKKIFLLLFSSLAINVASAQDVGFTISYPMSFSLGDFDDYIAKTSFRGISMELNKRVKTNLDIGVETSWSVFYEKADKATYTEGTASITGVQYRYTHTVPILAHARYYHGPGSGKKLIPYAGLGVGTMYVDRFTDFGLYRISNDAWQFCLRPEAGLAVQTKNMPAVILGVKYYAGFDDQDLNGQSYFSVNIGIMFSGF
jgi:opacity protein-like surface antigen